MPTRRAALGRKRSSVPYPEADLILGKAEVWGRLRDPLIKSQMLLAWCTAPGPRDVLIIEPAALHPSAYRVQKASAYRVQILGLSRAVSTQNPLLDQGLRVRKLLNSLSYGKD